MNDGYIHDQVCNWHETIADMFAFSEWELFIEEGGEVMINSKSQEIDFIHGIPNIYEVPKKYFGESLLPLLSETNC